MAIVHMCPKLPRSQSALLMEQYLPACFFPHGEEGYCVLFDYNNNIQLGVRLLLTLGGVTLGVTNFFFFVTSAM